MDKLIYTPEDILNKEVSFEILPDAHSAPLHCPVCGEQMAVVEAIRSIASGRFAVPYQIYECHICGRRYLNPEQAGHFSAILQLERLVEEKGRLIEGDILFDGRNLFIRLPLARELFQPRQPTTP